MNRIYSKIWDQATRQVVVASELAKRKGKGKGARLLQAVALAGALSTGPALAMNCDPGAPQGFPDELECGNGAAAIGIGATALGYNAYAFGDGATALGADSWASGNSATALGWFSTASADNAVAIGAASTASTQNAVAVGPSAQVSGQRSAALGYNARASETNTTALGYSTEASAFGATAVGQSARSAGRNSVALGSNASANRDDAMALGANTFATELGSTALGSNAIADAQGSVALGADSDTEGRANTVSVGGGGAGDRQITNVAAGTELTDAVNLGQLGEAIADATESSKFFQASGNDPSNPTDGIGAFVDGLEATSAGEASACGQCNRSRLQRQRRCRFGQCLWVGGPGICGQCHGHRLRC